MRFPDIQGQLELSKNEKGYHGMALDILIKRCVPEIKHCFLSALKSFVSAIFGRENEKSSSAKSACRLLEAKQYVLKHHFKNKRNFGVNYLLLLQKLLVKMHNFPGFLFKDTTFLWEKVGNL